MLEDRSGPHRRRFNERYERDFSYGANTRAHSRHICSGCGQESHGAHACPRAQKA